MKDKYSYYFRTQDFEEALILSSANAILTDVEWDYRGEIGTFVFEDEKKCLSILEKHNRKELKIYSHNVLFAYRNTKNQLYKSR